MMNMASDEQYKALENQASDDVAGSSSRSFLENKTDQVTEVKDGKDAGRFPKLERLNYKRGAIDYPHRLTPSNRYHLYTKPFYNLANKVSRWAGEGLDEDTQRHFCDFANMAYLLALPAGASILDVGCGSGWLSEFFARLGYRMTGVDISPEMIRIAEERLSRLPFGVDQESPLNYAFHAHDIEVAPLQTTFDAVVCYDSLHHFEDATAVLRNINAMLNRGGQLFIAEGEQPPEGSDEATELRQVMSEYETLEAPFSKEHLLRLLEQQGFAVTGDYAAIAGFVDRDNILGNSVRFVEMPSFNYLLCQKVADGPLASPVRDSSDPGLLRAELDLKTQWQQRVKAGSKIEFDLSIKNSGDSIWLVSQAPLRGRVRLGLKVLNDRNEVIEEVHGRPRFQTAIAPESSTVLKVTLDAPKHPGRYTLKLDLLSQEVCWFEERGSGPLVLEFEVAPEAS
jgi:2-polyprenyl-3-methyl-5-hydroxy-6-metoxy-1,4-benzoquinol methylase